MELVVVGWILPILQNYISEIVLDGKEGLLKKWKHKRFLKKLDRAIIDFCDRNECCYLDSGAFEYFVRSTDFLKKIVERAVSTKIEESDKVFFTSWIEKAREIANAEAISFSPNLIDVDQRAQILFEQTVKSLTEQERVTEKLKAENMMLWVRKMNNIRNRATEIVNKQVIYR